MATATVSKPLPKQSRPGVVEATFPVRMLHAVGAAFKQNTRYAMSSLLLVTEKGDGSAKTDRIVCVATDGRQVLIVKHDNGLFDTDELNLMIPGDVARRALADAAKGESDEPKATIIAKRNAYTLEVATPSGKAQFHWHTDGDLLPFPPYEDLVPKFFMGVSEIGVSPDRMARTCTIIKRVIGPEHTAKLYMPRKSEDPMGLEATDGATIEVTAVVMPKPISDWTETPKAANDKDDPHQGEMFAAWRTSSIDELDVSDAIKAKLRTASLVTIGALSDYEVQGSMLSDIEGLTANTAAKLDEAVAAWFTARQVERPTKPPTPEEVAAGTALENLLTYLHQRLVSLGVSADTLAAENAQGTKIVEGVLALVLPDEQKANVGKAMEAGTAHELKGWHKKLKNLSDDAYRKAIKMADTDTGATGKRSVLPS